MRWWPVAATVSAAAFVVAMGSFLLAPSFVALCDSMGEPGRCDSFVFGARSLVVGSGAFLTASLVAGLYTALLSRTLHLGGPEEDTRPLVSVHARRRH